MTAKMNGAATTQPAYVGSTMDLSVKVWLYLKPDQKARVSEWIAQHMTKIMGNLANPEDKWSAYPVSDPEGEEATASIQTPVEAEKAAKASPDGEEVFTSVVIAIRGVMNTGKPKLQSDVFEEILQCVNRTFRFNLGWIPSIPSLGSKRIICWLLWDPTAKRSASSSKNELGRRSVWVLQPPKPTPAEKPAEKIEEALYQLVHITQGKPDKQYLKPIEGRKALEAIQDLLYQQKTVYGQLQDAQEALEDAELEDDSVPKYVQDYIQALEEIDKALSSLVSVYDHNVGLISSESKGKSTSESSWITALGSLLLRLFGKIVKRGAYGSISIRDEHLEELKANARRELKHLQRIAPIIAAHARLRQLVTAQELKEVCDLAPEGPERSEIPSKLAVQPANLLNKQAQASSLAGVLKFYETAHEKVIEQVEALDKFVGKKFAEDGTKIFRDKKDRNWVDPDCKPSDDDDKRGPKRGKFRRLIVKLSNHKNQKKLDVLKGTDTYGDSVSDKSFWKEDWCEKA